MPTLRRMMPELILIPAAIIMLLPIFIMAVTAFKPESEILNPQAILPEHWSFTNFRQILGNPEEIPIARWLLNSLVVSTCVTALTLAVTSLAAFAFARLDLPGGRYVFLLVIATMMIPGQVLLVPVYLELNALGWLDSLVALIIPPAASAFGVFLLHQFFLGIPRSLDESVYMDGGTRWHVFRHVALPVARPAIVTLGIFVFIASWNDFISPMVFIDSSENFTLPVGIALFQTAYYTDYGLTLAASVIATIPVIIIFLLYQRRITEGIALTGLKE